MHVASRSVIEGSQRGELGWGATHHRLQQLIEPYLQRGGIVLGRATRANLARIVFLRQGVPTAGTVLLYLLGSLWASGTSGGYLLSCFVVVSLFGIYSLLQYQLLQARATAMHRRAVWKVQSVLQRQTTSVGGTPENGVLAIAQGIDHALLGARSLRLVACRSASATSSPLLQIIPKCLMPRGAMRWDAVDLKWDLFRETHDHCKLVEAMRLILERDAVKLKPLTNLARPPRLPNLRIASLLAEEEIESTDESDGERDTRSVIGGMSTTSMPHRAEYFTLRVLTLLWVAGSVLLVTVGFIRWICSRDTADGTHRRSAGVECLLLPALSMMGLIPHNALVVNRILYLRNNATLDVTVKAWIRNWGCGASHFSGTERSASRLVLSTWRSLLSMVWHGLFHDKRKIHDVPVFLARSTVETLGTVTAVAALDHVGVLTDLEPLPVRLLVIRENRGGSSSGSSSSDEDERMYLTQKSLEATRQQKKAMRMQVRRKRFQEERFTEMELVASAPAPTPTSFDASAAVPNNDADRRESATPNGSNSVEFANMQERHTNAQSINPVCLAVILHASVPPTWRTINDSWAAGLWIGERSASWSRSLLWIARAAGYKDNRIAENFKVIARLMSMRAGKKGNPDSVGGTTYPDQLCSLVCSDRTGQTHVFTIGSTRHVIDCCTSYWTGLETEEFDDHEKAEVTFFAEKQWSAAQGMEPVAIAHRVLPDRYQRFVGFLEAEAASLGHPVERFFVNDKEVRQEDDLTEVSVRTAATNPAGGMRRQCSADHLVPDLLDGTMRPNEAAVASTLPPGLRMRRTLSQGDVPSYHCGPIETDAALTIDTFARHMCSTSLTMLGLIALRESLRPRLESVVEALGDAGIRFMHFGSGTEQRTKAFGGRLGLETDWNTCISLKAESVALDQHSIRAQLPFGITSIRKHIIYVDPIPLQVSLFSHARGVATRSMLAVLQDNHEVVLALGSTCSHSNTRTFVQADYAIGVTPSRGANGADVCTGGHDQRPSGLGVGSLDDVSVLLSAACSIDAGRCPNILPIVFQLIAESRQMLSAMSSCTEFMLHANLFIVSVLTLWFVLGLPHFLTPGAIIFILNALVPLLGVACNSNHRLGVDPMQLKQCKQNFDTRWLMFRHSAVVFALRYVPTIVWTFALSLLLVRYWCKPDHYSAWTLRLSQLTATEEACLADTQSIMFYLVVLYLITHSLVHLSRYETPSLITCRLPRRTAAAAGGDCADDGDASMHRADSSVRDSDGSRRGSTAGPFSGHRALLKNSRSLAYFDAWRCAPGWFIFAAIVSICAIAFEVLDHHGFTSYQPQGAIPVEMLLIVIAVSYPLVVIAMDRPIKRWRLRRFAEMQKFRTLSYGTRLGMHSPRGDYEPSEEDESPVAADGGGGGSPAGHMTHINEGSQHSGFATSIPGSPAGDAHAGDDFAAASGRGGFMSWRRRTREFFFRWCSVSGGALERHCVCCDHIGGHPAQYCK